MGMLQTGNMARQPHTGSGRATFARRASALTWLVRSMMILCAAGCPKPMVQESIVKVSIGAPSVIDTLAGPVTYPVTYANAAEISLYPDDVTLATSGSVTGRVSVHGLGTSARNVTISNIRGNGSASIALAAGTASDASGNPAPRAVATKAFYAHAVLESGSGFTAPTPQPPAIGSGAGADAKAIARWDVVPYQTFDDLFEIGVVAFHINGIDRVEFSLDGGPWTAVKEMTLNPRTNVVEYWVALDAARSPDGPVEVRAIAYPKKGVPRVLGGEDVTVANGEHSMPLFANAQQSFVPQPVFVSLSGDDAAPGTQGQPVATISRALDVVQDGGEVILLDAGTYEGPANRSQRVMNTRWITVHPAPGLNAEDVTISRPEWSVVRPEVKLLAWQDVSFNFGKIQQYYALLCLFWFDKCHWFDELGWEHENGRSVNVRDCYYATDTTAFDMLYAFANARLARGCHAERISGDVFQNSNLVVNCTAENVDGTVLEHHTDLYQMWNAADNTILYGMEGNNLVATQSFFLVATLRSAPGEERSALSNSAFVDLNIINTPVMENGQNWGGPPWSQMQSSFDHVLFRNVKLPNQRLMLRTELSDPLVTNLWFEAKDVVFEDCLFHRETWRTYCAPTATPIEGVRFVDCTYASPVKTRDDSGKR